MTMKQITFSNGKQVCVLGQGTWNMGRNPLKRKGGSPAYGYRSNLVSNTPAMKES